MSKNSLSLASRAGFVLLLSAGDACAYGARHVGYTHVGPSGVYHAGHTAAYGPGGARSAGHVSHYGGASGTAYRAGYGAHYGAYGGAYHAGYTTQHDVYAAGGFRAGGVYGTTTRAGYYRRW
jgi:hypothetical protein